LPGWLDDPGYPEAVHPWLRGCTANCLGRTFTCKNAPPFTALANAMPLTCAGPCRLASALADVRLNRWLDGRGGSSSPTVFAVTLVCVLGRLSTNGLEFLPKETYRGYSGWRSWNDGLGRIYSTFADFQAQINAGRPIVVYMSGSSYYGNHFVTGVGWRVDTKNWVVIHDTWSTTGTNIYVDYASSTMGTPGWTYVLPPAI